MVKFCGVVYTLVVCSALLVGQGHAGVHQEAAILPSVIGAEVPFYPAQARLARIEGVVHVIIKTDGHRVTAVQPDSGPKMLAAAAESNIKTWEFATHAPTTLAVTYRYKLVPESRAKSHTSTVILRLPIEVEVIATPIPVTDPAPDTKADAPKSS